MVSGLLYGLSIVKTGFMPNELFKLSVS